MRVYVTARYKEGGNSPEIEQVCDCVRAAGLEDFCFVRDIQKVFQHPEDLMDCAKQEIADSDALLLDLSDRPSSGRIVEAGIAYALGKPVIILKRPDTVVSPTISGIAATVITYTQLEEIIPALQAVAASMAGR
jgi:nucleoside 2-deoxyribosyltransferase